MEWNINQTDTVRIQSRVENTATWIIGGGLKYDVGPHWGVRIDLRDHFNRDPVRVTVDTSPTTIAGSGATPALRVAFAPPLVPTVVFPTTPSVPSTLGTSIVAFGTFTGTALVHQINVSGGLAWRF